MEVAQPNVAVVGCGYWGRNLIRVFRDLGALSVVCDEQKAGRDEAQRIAPEATAPGNFEEVLARRDVQCIVLATPAETHESLALQAIAAGRDVLVEKPMALNYQQGLRMHRAATDRDCILMVGHLLEYHPAVLRLRELVADGALGRVNYIYSNRLNLGKIRTEENALWSFAPHDIAVILRLVGELPLEVTCTGGTYVTPNLADITMSCFHFRSGLRAHIFVSWLNPFKEQKLVVVGDRQMAVFNDVLKEDKLVLYNQRVDLNNRQPVIQKGPSEIVQVPADEPLQRECKHFLDCVRTRRKPLTDSLSGMDVLRVLEACQVSLQLNGRPTLVTENFARAYRLPDEILRPSYSSH
jgi:UDP-2-acetamido-3-amino-2,3-dideoxy-glucuronate N-acetyltransferase